jgi:glycosyltransferase involved in cell wall biosynthesis
VIDRTNSAPPRVLHIVENLDNGAVENWLIRMLRVGCESGTPVDWTFFCILQARGRFDEVVRALGANVVHSEVPLHSTLKFARKLRGFVAAGRYDVVHCHHDITSAFYLMSMLGLPVRRRIVHVHNGDLALPTNNSRKAGLLREPMRQLCLRLANQVVGISKYTLEKFVNGQYSSERDRVLYYGVDTTQFRDTGSNRVTYLKSLQLPADARILLFAGRLIDIKNPLFVVDILAEMAKTDSSVFAVFAGTGPLSEALRERAENLKMLARVRILGWRDDTAQLMRHSDVFVFPRVEAESPGVGLEGLGLVVIESQAAGLPALLSRGIPGDAILDHTLCKVVSLADGPAVWAKRAFDLLAGARITPECASAILERSPFSLKNGLSNLLALDEI